MPRKQAKLFVRGLLIFFILIGRKLNMSRRLLHNNTVLLFGIFMYASSPVVNFIQRNKTVLKSSALSYPVYIFQRILSRNDATICRNVRLTSSVAR